MSLKYISAAADGSVLGIDPTGQIVQAITGPSWNTIPSTNISGSLTSIGAGSDGTVWGISNPGSVWQYASGTGWTQVACSDPVTQISVGSLSNIWAVDATGNVYQYVAGSGFTSRGSGISSVSAASDGSVWGLNGSGVPQQYDGSSWTAISGGPEAFISISAGTAAWVAAVGKSGTIYQYDPGNPHPWQAVPTGVEVKFNSVSAGDDTTIWALDASGNAYHYGMAQQDWVNVASQGSDLLSQVSVGDEDAIWGIDSKGNIYQIKTAGPVWQPVASNSNLVKLSVASADNVWALDGTGNIYQNTGGLANWKPQSITGGPLSVVSAAEDGTVWGLSPGATQGTYNVVRYGGSTIGWEPITCPYAVVDISVGNAKTVIASDGAGNVYEYLGVDGWKLVPASDTKATGVSVASDGTMWGISLTGKPCGYLGKTMGWYPLPADTVSVQQVAVGSSTNVWAIDTSDNATQLVSNAAMMSEASIAPPRSSLTNWDTENPFDEAQSTHLWIVNRAAQLAGQDPNYGSLLLQLFPPFQGQIGNNGSDQGFHDKLCQGLYDVDFLSKYNGPSALGQPSYASHFYDPDTGKNWLGSSSWTALVQGRKLFWKALDYYVNGDMPNAGYHLGLSMHYLTDLTQPMHAANFTWLSSFKPGYHTGFESYVMEMQSTVSPPSTLPANSFGSDPGVYFITAATNSKQNYFSQITPLSIIAAYGLLADDLTSGQRTYIQQYVAPILTDAITITAQYMVAWMAMTEMDIKLCQFISSDSGYAMDITNGSSSAGANVQQYTWNNTEAQGFRLVQLTGADEGYCAIIATCSAMALDVDQSTPPKIIQNTYNSLSDSQKWQFIKTDEATVSIKNKNSGLLITVPLPQRQSGTQLILGTPEHSGAQQWQLTPATPFYMQLLAGGLSLNLDSSKSPNLMIWNANTSDAQHFLLVPLGGDDVGYYMILAADGGLAFSGASQQVMLEQWHSSDAQKWMLAPAEYETYITLQNKASGEYMFVSQQSGQYQAGTYMTTSAMQGVPLLLSPAPPLNDVEMLEEIPTAVAAAAG